MSTEINLASTVIIPTTTITETVTITACLSTTTVTNSTTSVPATSPAPPSTTTTTTTTTTNSTNSNNNNININNNNNNNNINNNNNSSSLKQLKNSLYLDLSSTNSSLKKQNKIDNNDLLNFIKSSPNFEKIFSQAASATPTPTPTKLLYPTEVSLAQRQYAQGFIDALTQVQQLNGFVPTPTLLNSPSFLAPLLQSSTSSDSTVSDVAKSISSPVLTSPTKESFSVIMQAAMNGMGTLGGYGFPQLAPNLTYATPHSVVAHSPTTLPSTSALSNNNINSGSGRNEIVVPNTTGINLGVGSSGTIIDEIKEMSYELYAATTESNNDVDTNSSIRSNGSPRSQEEMLSSFPSDSFDVIDQERKKLERKRARNRMAATKCRQRKLQKISELEKQVCEEKSTGNRLSHELKLLEASVAQLRQTLHEHRTRGCVISTK